MHTPPLALEENIFEIVGQLNCGGALIAPGDERERLANLNLLATRRAKASAAYESALAYARTGAAYLPDDAWERRYELAFTLELHRAEREFLTGSPAEAQARLAELARRATSLADLARVTHLRVVLFMSLGRSDQAIIFGLDYANRADASRSRIGLEFRLDNPRGAVFTRSIRLSEKVPAYQAAPLMALTLRTS